MTLEEFIADAKKRPEQIVYSSGGLYGASHLPVAMLEKAAGLSKLRHLPTAGGGPAITALLGNNAQASTQTVLATLQHIKAGKLRPLASFGAQRSKALPDVPTLKERGYDVVYYLWVGLFVPKGTPAAIVSTLGNAVDKAAASPQFNSAIANIGLEPSSLSAADFVKFWDEDAKRSDDAVRQIGKVGRGAELIHARADHVAGGAFVALGIVVFAISGDLPFGTLSAPGAGMMPKLMAGLMMVFAAADHDRRRLRTGARPRSTGATAATPRCWSLVTAVAVALYQPLGFLITMTLLVFSLLVLVERRSILPAAIYSIALTVFAYWLFGKALKSPLERGLLWF